MFRSQERAAERRWRRHNEEAKAKGCLCGKPGTHVTRSWGRVGRVAPEFWRCEEHARVPLDAGWSGNGDGTFSPSYLLREYQEGDRWIREFGRDGVMTSRSSQDIRYRGM